MFVDVWWIVGERSLILAISCSCSPTRNCSAIVSNHWRPVREQALLIWPQIIIKDKKNFLTRLISKRFSMQQRQHPTFQNHTTICRILPIFYRQPTTSLRPLTIIYRSVVVGSRQSVVSIVWLGFNRHYLGCRIKTWDSIIWYSNLPLKYQCIIPYPFSLSFPSARMCHSELKRYPIDRITIMFHLTNKNNYQCLQWCPVRLRWLNTQATKGGYTFRHKTIPFNGWYDLWQLIGNCSCESCNNHRYLISMCCFICLCII